MEKSGKIPTGLQAIYPQFKLYYQEQEKDMIIVGGFNVYPKEVEEGLYTRPKVALAAVIGLPDPRSGETVKAFVQLKPGARLRRRKSSSIAGKGWRATSGLASSNSEVKSPLLWQAKSCAGFYAMRN